MSSLQFMLSAALAALILSITAVALQVLYRRHQIRSFSKNGLTPNILLTRYPLVFVNRKRRLFRLFGDFNIIPLALREHGFEVKELELPPADTFSSGLSLNELDHALAKLERPAHLFLHPSIEPPSFTNPKVMSVTPFNDHSIDQALRRAVSLAERDLQ